MSKKINSSLKQPAIKQLESSISLSNFTTLRVGGKAEWLAEPQSIEEIKVLVAWAQESKINCHIIGAGSNLLISDSGLDGLVICLKKFNGSSLDPKTGFIEANGGEAIPTLARRAAKAGLHGLEWAVGIPGTVGGAAVMNAGAQGSCIAEWIKSVTVLPLMGGEPFEISHKDLEYSYRHSRLQKENLLVLSAQFLLKPGNDKQTLNRITKENLLHRTQTQPYHLPNCGSVFRNPEPFKAGKLIENLGLKGLTIGGAQISEVHANFIVNTGKATAKDIQMMISMVKTKVKEAHSISLHPEVIQLGFDSRV